MSAGNPPVRVQHGSVSLALHALREGEGRPLLLLHGLGERSPASPPPEAAGWPGPVFALDFTGHGESTLPVGGGYTAELLAADADAALEQLGSATLLGRGVGAYAALILAGGRPDRVRGALLCDGPGLSGGGPAPGPPAPPAVPGPSDSPDPLAALELSADIRPPGYAAGFARIAAQRSGIELPVSVCAQERPPWLAQLVGQPGVAERSPEQALSRYAALP